MRNQHECVTAFWFCLSLGLLLSIITLVAGVGLLALSGWFIAAAGFSGLSILSASAFNYFSPAAGVRFFSLIRIVSRYFERLVTHDGTFKILTQLRLWVYTHLEPLAPGHLLRYRSGDLLNRLVNDVDALDNLYLRVLSPLFSAISLMILMFIFLHFFAVSIAWAVLIALIITGVFIPLLMLHLGKYASTLEQICTARLRTTTVETLQGLREFAIYQAIEARLIQLEKMNHTLIYTQARLALLKGLSTALMIFISSITVIIVLLLSVYIFHQGLLNGANISLVTLGTMAAFESVIPLPLAFQYLGKTQKAAERLLELIETAPSVTFTETATNLTAPLTLQLTALSFGYTRANDYVLENCHLNVKFGEKIGILGKTGSGKSTIAHLLTRFWDPLQGEITLGGVPLQTFSEAQLRKHVSLLSQKVHIFNNTLRYNLRLANPTAKDDSFWKILAKVHLTDFVKTLPEGLDTWLGEQGVNLSGGQMRRLALAQILLHDAPIWILDEPLEGLDNLTKQALRQNLETLWENRTVIMITHQPSELSAMDCVYTLQDKKLVRPS